MRYVNARIEEKRREEAYRVFVTKSLQLIPQQKYIDKNYYNLFEPKKEEPSGEQIMLDVMKHAGISFGG